jgi:hypothetical protein
MTMIAYVPPPAIRRLGLCVTATLTLGAAGILSQGWLTVVTRMFRAGEK